MLDIVIVGAGGFAREVFTQLEDCLPDCEFRVKGFLARESGELKKVIRDYSSYSGFNRVIEYQLLDSTYQETEYVTEPSVQGF